VGVRLSGEDDKGNGSGVKKNEGADAGRMRQLPDKIAPAAHQDCACGASMK
jgi:hypothetical protein